MADAEMAEPPAIDEAVPAQAVEGQETQGADPNSEQPSVKYDPQSEPVAAATGGSTSAEAPVPEAFPKKRRGRPPGRPNMAVQEALYKNNPLVLAWNAARGERAVSAVPIGIRAALTEQSLIHETQRAIFRLPSRETIYFVEGWITARHIASQRPSYVNGLLIHSRGLDSVVACVQCVERRAKNALGPFLTCRVLPGSFHNSCSNCKWFDNTSSCSLYTGPRPNRKRKAKEQLPPPPTGFHNPGGPHNTHPAAATQPHQLQPVPQPGTPQGPVPSQPPVLHETPPLAEPKTRADQTPQPPPEPYPEPEMMPAQAEHQEHQEYQEHHEGQEEQLNSTPTQDGTENEASAHSQPKTEASGSDFAETHSPSVSLSESHFVLPKPEGDRDTPEPHDEDAE